MKKKLVSLAVLLGCASSISAFAYEKGDIVVRGGLATVAPDESTSNVVVGEDLGFGLTVDNNTQLGLNFAYFLTDRINVEVLAATPFSHDISFDTENPLMTGNQLGSTKHLPPTVTLNYFFNDTNSDFQPYIGAGINYTVFFDEEFTSANSDIGLDDLSLDNSFGLSATLGADYMLDDKWLVNASVRWVDIDTEATFNLNGAAGSVGTVEIDPWVYTISVGYRF